MRQHDDMSRITNNGTRTFEFRVSSFEVRVSMELGARRLVMARLTTGSAIASTMAATPPITPDLISVISFEIAL